MSEMVENGVNKCPDELKLNLGCGPIQPKGWVNVDGSNRAWLAVHLSLIDKILVKCKLIPKTEFGRSTTFCNLLKGLPYKTNSVTCIYAGELWEHFEYEDAFKLTKEVYRALIPNGVIRICVPDGPTFWKKYLKIYENMMSKPQKTRDAEPLRRYTQMFFDDICTRRMIIGSMGHTHKWQYDEVQLIDMLEKNGFTQVGRMSFGESRIPNILAVERSNFLIVEGVKPK